MHRGVTASEVSSAPQMSSGTFPLTQQEIVPDEQCFYNGSWGLIIVYWKLTPAQVQDAAEHFVAEHFAYRCKTKVCKTFVAFGSHTISVTTASGKQTTVTQSTLNVVVLNGAEDGEVSVNNPPKAASPCDDLATEMDKVFGGAGSLLDCP